MDFMLYPVQSGDQMLCYPLSLSIVMSLLLNTQLVPLICYWQVSWLNEHSEVKRKKVEIKLESDNANDNFSFPETMSKRDKRGEETERFVSHRYSFHSCIYMNGHLLSTVQV